MKKIGVLLLAASLPVCSLAATEIAVAKVTYKIVNKTTNVIAYQKSKDPDSCEPTTGTFRAFLF